VAEPVLSSLLSRLWVAFAIEVDSAVEEAATDAVRRLFRVSLSMWANGLRLIPAAGVSLAELRARAGAACNIGGLERWGWINVGDGPGRRPGYGTSTGLGDDTVVRPSRAGTFARRVWPEVIAEVEQRWPSRFGAGRIDALAAAAAPHGAGMPWSVPQAAPSNGFFTRVTGTTEEQPEAVVLRLGQALTAVTLRCEDGAPVSAPLGSNLLRVVGPDGLARRDLPAAAGVSKEAAAMATSFALRRQLVEDEGRTLRLTAAGQAPLAGWEECARAGDHAGLRRAVTAITSRGEELAMGLGPPEGGWRGQHPYLAQTRRLMADPMAALPWQPMVLHRGGWPDGS